jgi:hypothetical protein
MGYQADCPAKDPAVKIPDETLALLEFLGYKVVWMNK